MFLNLLFALLPRPLVLVLACSPRPLSLIEPSPPRVDTGKKPSRETQEPRDLRGLSTSPSLVETFLRPFPTVLQFPSLPLATDRTLTPSKPTINPTSQTEATRTLENNNKKNININIKKEMKENKTIFLNLLPSSPRPRPIPRPTLLRDLLSLTRDSPSAPEALWSPQ